MHFSLGLFTGLLGFVTGLLVMQALKSPYFLLGNFVNLFFKVYCLLLWYYMVKTFDLLVQSW